MRSLNRRRPARLARRLLWTSALAGSLFGGGAAAAQFLPNPASVGMGGDVIATTGAPTLALTNPNQLDVTLTAPATVIDWQRFDIGTGQSANFLTAQVQDIRVLNRVRGVQGMNAAPPTITNILGALTSSPNVAVFIVNPAGVIFGSNGSFSGGSLILSTLDTTNTDFTNNDGNYRFTGSGTGQIAFSGGATALANGGTIAGSVIALGQNINQARNIVAGGDIAFVAATDVSLNFVAGSPLGITVSAGTTLGTAKVTAGGLLEADSVVIGGARSSNVIDALLNVNALGVLTATESNGRVIISAGAGTEVFGSTAGIRYGTFDPMLVFTPASTNFGESAEFSGALASAGNTHSFFGRAAGNFTATSNINAVRDVTISAGGKATVQRDVVAGGLYRVTGGSVELGANFISSMQTAAGLVSITATSGDVVGMAPGGGSLTLQSDRAQTGTSELRVTATTGAIDLGQRSFLMGGDAGGTRSNVRLDTGGGATRIGQAAAQQLFIDNVGNFTAGAASTDSISTFTGLNLTTVGSIDIQSVQVPTGQNVIVKSTGPGGNVRIGGDVASTSLIAIEAAGTATIAGNLTGGSIGITANAVALGTGGATRTIAASENIAITAGAGGVTGTGALNLQSDTNSTAANGSFVDRLQIASVGSVALDATTSLVGGAMVPPAPGTQAIVLVASSAGSVSVGSVQGYRFQSTASGAIAANGPITTFEGLSLIAPGNVSVKRVDVESANTASNAVLLRSTGGNASASGAIATGGAVTIAAAAGTASATANISAGTNLAISGNAVVLGSTSGSVTHSAQGSVVIASGTGNTTIDPVWALTAPNGPVTFTGRVVGSGSLNVDTAGAITTGDVALSGAGSVINLRSSGGFVDTGALAAPGFVALDANGVARLRGNANAGTSLIVRGGTVELGTAAQTVPMVARGPIVIEARAPQGTVTGFGNLVLTPNTDATGNDPLLITAPGGINLGAGSAIFARAAGNESVVTLNGGTGNVAFGRVDAGSLSVVTSGGNISAGGPILSTQTVNLTSSGNVAVGAVSIRGANGSMVLRSTGGNVSATGFLDAPSNIIVEAAGNASVTNGVTAGGGYSVSGAQVTLGNGGGVTQSAAAGVTIAAGAGGVADNGLVILQSNNDGTIVPLADPERLFVNSTGPIALGASILTAGRTPAGVADERQSNIIIAGGAGDVTLGTVAARSLQVSGLSGNFSTTGAVTLHNDVSIVAPGTISIPTLLASGATANVVLNAGNALQIGTRVAATGNITASGSSVNVAEADAGGALSLTANGGQLTLGPGGSSAGTTVAIRKTGGAGDLRVIGPLQSVGLMSIDSDSVLQVGEGLTLTSTAGDVNLRAAFDILNPSNPREIPFTNDAVRIGTIAAAGNVTVNAQGDVRARTIGTTSGGISVTGLGALTGLAVSGDPGDSLAGVRVSAGGNVTINAGRFGRFESIQAGASGRITADAGFLGVGTANAAVIDLQSTSGPVFLGTATSRGTVNIESAATTRLSGPMFAAPPAIAIDPAFGGAVLTANTVPGQFVTVNEEGRLRQFDTINASGAINITGAAVSANSVISSGGGITLEATTGGLYLGTGDSAGFTTLRKLGGNATTADQGDEIRAATLGAGGGVGVESSTNARLPLVTSRGGITVTTALDTIGGSFDAAGGIAITATRVADIDRLRSDSAIGVGGGAVIVDRVDTATALNLTANSGDLTLGFATAGTTATLIKNSSGTLAITGLPGPNPNDPDILRAGGAITLRSQGSTTLAVGKRVASSGGTITLTSAGPVSGGTLDAGSDILANGTQRVDFERLRANGNVTVSGALLDIDRADAGGALSLTALQDDLILGFGTAGGAATLTKNGGIGSIRITGTADPLANPGDPDVLTAANIAAVSSTGIAIGSGKRLTATAGDIRLIANGGNVSDIDIGARADLRATALDSRIVVNAAAGDVRLGTLTAGAAGAGSAQPADQISVSGRSVDLTRAEAINGGVSLTATAGDLLLGSVSAGTSIALASFGAITIGQAEALEDLGIQTGGTATIGRASAGDDLVIKAGGDIAIETALASGSARDDRRHVFGGSALTVAAGDADLSRSNIVLDAAGAITLGTAADASATFVARSGQGFAANTAPVSPAIATIRAGEDVAVRSGGAISLHSVQAGDDVALVSTGGSVTVSASAITNGAAPLDTRQANFAGTNLTLPAAGETLTGSNIIVDAAGAIALPGTTNAAATIALRSGSAITASMLTAGEDIATRAAGATSLTSALAGDDLVTTSGGALSLDTARASGTGPTVRDVNFGSAIGFGAETFARSNIVVDAGADIMVTTAADATATVALRSAGAITANSAANPAALRAGEDVALQAVGAVTVSKAIAGDDLVLVSTGGAVTLADGVASAGANDDRSVGFGATPITIAMPETLAGNSGRISGASASVTSVRVDGSLAVTATSGALSLETGSAGTTATLTKQGGNGELTVTMLRSGGDASLTSSTNARLATVTSTAGAITVSAAGEATGATLDANRDATVSAGPLADFDLVKAGGALSVTADAANIDRAEAGTALAMTARSGALTLGTGIAGTTATLTKQGGNGELTVTMLRSGGNAGLTSSTSARLATVTSTGGAIAVSAAGEATGGTLDANRDATVTAGPLADFDLVKAGGALSVTADAVNIDRAEAGAALALTARSGALTLGTGIAGTTANLTKQGSVGEVTVTMLRSGSDTFVSSSTNARLATVTSTGGAITVSATGEATGATLDANRDATVTAGALADFELVKAGGAVSVTADAANIDRAEVGTALAMTARSGALTLGTGIAGTTATLTKRGATGALVATSLTSGGDTTIESASDARLANVEVTGGNLAVTSAGEATGSTLSASGTISLAAGPLADFGRVIAGQSATVRANAVTIGRANATAGALSLTATDGGLTLGSGLAGTTASLVKQGAAGDLSLIGPVEPDGDPDVLRAGGAITLTSATNVRLANGLGVTSTGATIGVTAAGSVTGTGPEPAAPLRPQLGAIRAAGDLTITGIGDVRAQSLEATGGSLDVTLTGGSLSGTMGGVAPATVLGGRLNAVAAGQSVTVIAGSGGGDVARLQSIAAGGDVRVTAGGIGINSLSAGGTTTLTAGGGGLNLGIADLAGSAAIAIGSVATPGLERLVSSDATLDAAFGTVDLKAGGAITVDVAQNVAGKGIAQIGAAQSGGAMTVTAKAATITTANAGGALALTATTGGLYLSNASSGAAATLSKQGGSAATTGDELRVTGTLNAAQSASVNSATHARLGTIAAANGRVDATATSGAITGVAGATPAGLSDPGFGRANLSAGGGANAVSVTAATLAQLGTVSAPGAVQVSAQRIDAASTRAGTALTLNASNGELILGQGVAGTTASLTKAGDVATELRVLQSLAAAGDATLTSNSAARIGSVTSAGGNISVTSTGATTGIAGTSTATDTSFGRADLSAAANGKSVTVTTGGLAQLGTLAGGADVTVTAGNALPSNGAIDVASATATSGALRLTARATGAISGVNTGNIRLGTGSAGTTATLANTDTLGTNGTAGDITVGSALTANGAIAIESKGNAALGRVVSATGDIAVSSARIELSGPLQTTASGRTVTLTNRADATNKTVLGTVTGDTAATPADFALGDAELDQISTANFVVNSGSKNVSVGALSLKAATGASTIQLRSAGGSNITVSGAVTEEAAVSGRRVQIGGTGATNPSIATDQLASAELANTILGVTSASGGGSLLLPSAALELRSMRVIFGLPNFIAEIQTPSPRGAQEVADTFVSRPNSTLYNSIGGYLQTEGGGPTYLNANSLTLRYSQVALFQNSATAGLNSGVRLGPNTGIAGDVSRLILFSRGETPTNSIGLFGTINGIIGNTAGLLPNSVVTIREGNSGDLRITRSASRLNGCAIGAPEQGCLTTQSPPPVLRLFDERQALVLRTADDAVLPFDPLVGTNNEALFIDIGGVSLPSENEECAPGQPCPAPGGPK